MKERPIIFTHNIGKILSGDKTQTRRVIKDTGLYAIDEAIHGEVVAVRERDALATRCPYGLPGDRLWVREGFLIRLSGDAMIYRAEFAARYGPLEEAGFGAMYGGWKSPLLMPKVKSRITLELTDVRIQRLQEISEEDARAEGVEPWHESDLQPNGELREGPSQAFKMGFADLWDSINAKNRNYWESNPWVWAITFRRVTS